MRDKQKQTPQDVCGEAIVRVTGTFFFTIRISGCMLQSFVLVVSFSNFSLYFFSVLLNTLLFACAYDVALEQF